MDLLKRVKDDLSKVYGSRLKGIILYGSEARGEAEPDSDIDMLVILDGGVNLWEDIRKIVDAIYPLQLEVMRPIHALPVDVADYEAGEYALYRNAKRDGIPA